MRYMKISVRFFAAALIAALWISGTHLYAAQAAPKKKKAAPRKKLSKTEAQAEAFFRRGLTYFNKGSFERAYQDFRAATMLVPTNMDYRFNWARAAFETRRYERALELCEDMLATNPNLPRVKFELARAYMALNSLDVAAQYFNEVRTMIAEKPPKDAKERAILETVKTHIAHHLSLIEKKKAPPSNHRISGIVNYSLNFDSNPAVKPSSDWVSDTNLGTIYLPQNSPHSDFYHSGMVALSHVYTFTESDFSWKSDFAAFTQFYTQNKFDAQNLTFFMVKTGPAYRAGRFMATLQGSMSYLTFNARNLYRAQPYMEAHGGEMALTYLLLPPTNVPERKPIFSGLTMPLGFSVKHEKHKFLQHNDRDKDSYNTTYTLKPDFIWQDTLFTTKPQRSSLNLSLSTEHNAADIRSETYDTNSISVRFSRYLPDGYTPYTAVSYKRSNYDHRQTLFLKKRRDSTQKYTIGLSKQLPHDLILDFSINHTRAISNIGLYEYKRNLFTLSLTKLF